jgi:ornithine cyclodeaminase/alanine dehydrogenase-like protein (mu-crystallin family)
MTLLVLHEKHVEYLYKAKITTPELLKNQAHVFKTLAATPTTETSSSSTSTDFESPSRTSLSLKDATTLVMPARLGNAVTCKVVGVPRQGSGLSAATMVMDEKTGAPTALVNATALTALRTAAGECI